jgi:hypothetical protein
MTRVSSPVPLDCTKARYIEEVDFIGNTTLFWQYEIEHGKVTHMSVDSLVVEGRLFVTTEILEKQMLNGKKKWKEPEAVANYFRSGFKLEILPKDWNIYMIRHYPLTVKTLSILVPGGLYLDFVKRRATVSYGYNLCYN